MANCPFVKHTDAVMRSSSRRLHDLGGLAIRPEEACEMHVKACTKRNIQTLKGNKKCLQ